MSELRKEQFEEYFRDLHGHDPFPWQTRLAETVTRTGEWPSVLDLPTGSGKTAALDIALFHLALSAGAQERTAPLRIVYVVDRRTIVDQAHDRACRIRERLLSASSGVLVSVRERLISFSREGDHPLQVSLLRGGIARSDSWARSPEQPLVAVSTVDQVGSRLLFRGYGVSPGMRPIHAGLLGNDVLYLLDEVHLSAPFCETLQAISQRYRLWGDDVPASPFHFVQMSATPGGAAGSRFALDEADLEDAVLRRRLDASKRVELREVSGSKLVAECEKEAVRLARAGATILVVVNRVRSARDIARRLQGRGDLDVKLITGRMRPLERQEQDTQLFERIRAGRTREAGARPLVVVATQCVEAGADFDFDALVTECASLDALRQRFGRLDRLGELGESRAVIVAASDSLKDDPVYGGAIGKTLNWLKGVPDLDFGPCRLACPPNESEMLAPRSSAPVLLPSHLDAWSQTSACSIPEPDPDVSLWLHGPQRGAADCQVVWRADLAPAWLATPPNGEAERLRGLAVEAVQSVPVSSGEAMPVPYAAVARWLDGQSEARVADVEGVEDEDADEADGKARGYVIWRGDDSTVGLGSKALRPGDTVVVPCEYGGVWHGSWAPECTDPVRDLAEVAAFRQRGRAMLRLNERVFASLVGPSYASGLDWTDVLPPDDAEDADDVGSVRTWLERLPDLAGWPADVVQIITLLRQEGRRIRVERVGMPPHAVVSTRRRFDFETDEFTTEDDQASFTGASVSLARHLGGVADFASDFAQRVGLSSTLVRDVRLAGLCHDLGKADPRFQRLLHGGSQFRAEVAPEPLAKSARLLQTSKQRAVALERSRYPRGGRHELQSVAMMLSCPALMEEMADRELVLHLVASHHGHCRPFAPCVVDAEPVDVTYTLNGWPLSAGSRHDLDRLDSGVGERFWLLVRRYGWWGLAWLEAMVRLGDHRESEAEQKGGR